ncbi:MAG TPA: tetratricopeptide repeat protein [Blastocatellia bacterium]|nr:tetratricopeptide repeat protein [Blastocatellia bacterium]
MTTSHGDAIDAIEPRYQALKPELQQFLIRLSVFRCGWTREAAEQVGNQPPALDARESLTELVNRSLLIVESPSGEQRWRMSPAVRDFGLGRLGAAKESIAERHADYFFSLAEQARSQLMGAEQRSWLDRLNLEHDNLRAALDHYRDRESAASQELALAVNLARFWNHGSWPEGKEKLQHALERQPPGDSAPKAHGLAWLGFLSYRLDHFEFAKQALSESAMMSRQLDDQESLAFSLHSLGVIAEAQGRHREARWLFMESLKIAQEANSAWLIGWAFHGLGIVSETEKDYEAAKACYLMYLSKSEEVKDLPGIAAALYCLGVIDREQRDYAEARQHLEKSLALRSELGNKWGIADCYFDLGLIEEALEGHQAARAIFQKSLALRQEIWDRRGIANALEGIGRVSLALGKDEDAARAFSEVETIRNSIGEPRPPHGDPHYVPPAFSIKDRFPSEWREAHEWALDEGDTGSLVKKSLEKSRKA